MKDMRSPRRLRAPTPRRQGVLPRGLLASLAAVSVLAAACSGDGSESDGGSGEEPGPVEVAGEAGCEVLDPAHCMLPFPSDHFTIVDESTATGLRVAFPAAAMPANAEGTPIDPTEWNRSDGFSPGAMLLAQMPGVDLPASGAPSVTDIGRSLEDDSPIVVIDSQTGERHPVWSELDANAGTDDGRLLIIRPAVALTEGHRYLVALRGLVDSEGGALQAPAAFAALRDGVPTTNEAVEARRDGMEELFGELEAVGVARGDLQMAWDFTVASAQGLSGRLLRMRDESFSDLGESAPEFSIDSVNGTPEGGRTVAGTVEVPLWLTGDGDPGSVLNNESDPDGMPSQNGSMQVPFVCTVPPAGGDGEAEKAGAALYGHGLLGTSAEALEIGAVAGPATNTAVCGTDWIGMSAADVPNVIEVLGDLSAFRSIPDRLQQAHLNFLFLGRALVHPDGLSSDPAFQGADGEPMLSGELVYIGGSQGGILGGATTAVAQDWRRALLAVGGMNYSTMLRRSIDFDEFALVFEPAYPDEAERTLALALVQMLWDRGEPQGYAQHITRDPYPGTPDHQVMLQEAFGDHQVANIATETFARTMGLKVRAPALAEGRATAEEPLWGIEPVKAPDSDGSYLVVWDFGSPAPPDENLPPRDGEDPHGKISGVPEFLLMAFTFLDEGRLIDVCGGEPCQTLG